MRDRVGNTVTEDGTKLFEIDICTTSSLEILGSADSWRHGLNLMANQLPKQSWLHDFAQNKSSYHSSREHSISRGLKVFSLCDALFFTFFIFFPRRIFHLKREKAVQAQFWIFSKSFACNEISTSGSFLEKRTTAKKSVKPICRPTLPYFSWVVLKECHYSMFFKR